MDRAEIERRVANALGSGHSPAKVLTAMEPLRAQCEPPLDVRELGAIIDAAIPAYAPAAAAPIGRARQLAEPQLVETAAGRRFTWGEAGISLAFAKLTAVRDTLTAEVVVDCDRERWPEAPARLHGPVVLDLLSTQRQAALSTHLERRLPLSGLWADIVEDACRRVIAGHRTPKTPVRLAEPRQGTARPLYAIDPLVLNNFPTMIFADGGIGKSMLALAIAAALDGADGVLPFRVVQPHRVLFLDWELDADVHTTRLASLLSPSQMAECGVQYSDMVADLPSQVAEVAAMCAERQITYLVIDSLALAAGDELTKDSTARAFAKAIRTIGLPSLWITHKPKPVKGMKSDGPFGSAFWKNLVRSMWEMKAEDEPSGGDQRIALFQRKANLGARSRAISLVFERRGERLNIRRTDIHGEGVWQSSLSPWMRIRDALSKGAHSALQVADITGLKPADVSTELKRLERAGRVVELTSGRWGLSSPDRPHWTNNEAADAREPIPFDWQARRGGLPDGAGDQP